MGEGDYMPISRHRRKYDPVHAKKIKEGGKKARKIHKETVARHKEEEIPQAEEELLKSLEELENGKIKKAKK
jgi:hypothetical protein